MGQTACVESSMYAHRCFLLNKTGNALLCGIGTLLLLAKGASSLAQGVGACASWSRRSEFYPHSHFEDLIGPSVQHNDKHKAPRWPHFLLQSHGKAFGCWNNRFLSFLPCPFIGATTSAWLPHAAPMSLTPSIRAAYTVPPSLVALVCLFFTPLEGISWREWREGPQKNGTQSGWPILGTIPSAQGLASRRAFAGLLVSWSDSAVIQVRLYSPTTTCK